MAISSEPTVWRQLPDAWRVASGASAAIRGPGGASASIRGPGVRTYGSNQFSRAHQHQFAPELYQRVLEQTVLTNLVGKNDTGGKGRTIGRSFGEALSRASLSRTGAASAIAEAASADGVSIGRGSMYAVVVSNHSRNNMQQKNAATKCSETYAVICSSQELNQPSQELNQPSQEAFLNRSLRLQGDARHPCNHYDCKAAGDPFGAPVNRTATVFRVG